MTLFDSCVLLTIGFSVGAALLLVLAFASTYRSMTMPWQSRVAGYVMLLGLALTQLLHARYLLEMDAALASRSYILIIVSQSVGFYWLFLGLLRPPQQKWLAWEWIVLPAAIVGGEMVSLNVAIPVAMLGGTLAAVHLGRLVYLLRAQRRWFLLEFRVLMLFALIAAMMAVASVAEPTLGWRSFAASYALLIGAGFALVLYLLLRFPDVVSKAEQAVASAYAVSTLSRIDRDRAVSEITRLFEQEKIYQDEDLSLAKLAELTQLSAHQLSELINTHFQMGFSRLVRQYRVEAAKRMFTDEPRASVLSVGLSVGFNSQSNFYVAFKEITGVVPGQFRKQLRPEQSDSRQD
ncbi:MAG TPA: helix-turn-helix domain-containing protein [Usitatibacteraceae bacterium]